jgi:phospholipid/cholesterol/gamma-HCH transport system substrate-binding protein
MTETIVGIFVIASLLLLLVLVIFIGRRQNIFQGRYQINGLFNSVGGLQTGADVQLAGITVGYVKDVRFGPNNKVNVIMSINENEQNRIRNDSVASIKTMGLMGDRYIAITVGTEVEPIIPPGGTIRTQEVIDLSDVLESARPTLENLENTMKNISDLTDRVASPEGDIATTIKNVRIMTTNMREGEGTIGALVQRDEVYDKANEILDTTKQTAESLRVASGNIQQASGNLPAIMEGVQGSVEKMDTFAAKAAATATEIYELVDVGEQVMSDAQTITGNLKSASEEVKKAAPRIGPLMESADEGIGGAKEVVEAAKRSWLLRGSFEIPAPEGPIAVGGRDIAEPEAGK